MRKLIGLFLTVFFIFYSSTVWAYSSGSAGYGNITEQTTPTFYTKALLPQTKVVRYVIPSVAASTTGNIIALTSTFVNFEIEAINFSMKSTDCDLSIRSVTGTAAADTADEIIREESVNKHVYRQYDPPLNFRQTGVTTYSTKGLIYIRLKNDDGATATGPGILELHINHN